MNIADFKLKGLMGETIDFSNFSGKRVMLVNVASECGLTPQYAQLEELHQAYGDKGLVVIGVPCNDFGAQEPGTADQIQTFCTTHYSVTFPLTEKIQVVGENKHPLYAWLTAAADSEVTWNFQKFLINEQGEVVTSVSPQTLPTDASILTWIETGNYAS